MNQNTPPPTILTDAHHDPELSQLHNAHPVRPTSTRLTPTTRQTKHALDQSYQGTQSSVVHIFDPTQDTPTAGSPPRPLYPVDGTRASSLTRKEDVRKSVAGVQAHAEAGAAVHEYQYGHELKHQLNSKTKGTHPELRNKFDKHLIDVIRNSHSHLLTDVHHDIMTGVIEGRIARQLAAMNAAMNNSNSGTTSASNSKHHSKHKKSDNETDLEAYASHMFAVSGVMMRDGVQDRNFVSHKYDAKSLKYYEMQYKTWYQAVMAISFFVLIFLVLFESPASQFLLTSSAITLPIELICLGIQSMDVFIRSKSLRHPLQERWLVVKGLCFSVCMLDWCIQFVCLLADARDVGIDFRVLRALRIVFFIEHYNLIRNEFTQALETIKKIMPAIFLVLATVLFFAGLGVAMFPRNELAAALGVDTTEGDLYIKDILAACIQLW